jgi:hypothetical protein
VFKQVLFAQWLTSRLALAVLSVLAFALPLISVFYGSDIATTGRAALGEWLIVTDRVAQVLPFFAVLVGALLGILAWSPDLAGRHVYALSLPVPRAVFVSLRFGAGTVLALIPSAALAAGAAIASMAVRLPPGVRAYPVEISVRFTLATLTVYAIIFALASASRRGQLAIIGAICAAILLDLALLAFGASFSVTAATLNAMITWPGPLSILVGRWALFDV